MRFKEKLTLTLRGYRMLHQLVPGAMLWAFVQNLVRALTPFLNVYLSGRIIDFLAQGRPLRDLLWLVGITVMVNALLKLTEQASGRTVDYLIEKLHAVWEKPLYEKIQTMDYARVEDVRTHAALSEIEIMRSTNGFGFMRLYFSFFHGVRGFFLVLFSLTLTIGAFIAQPAREAGGFRFLFSPFYGADLACDFGTRRLFRPLQLPKDKEKQPHLPEPGTNQPPMDVLVEADQAVSDGKGFESLCPGPPHRQCLHSDNNPGFSRCERSSTKDISIL